MDRDADVRVLAVDRGPRAGPVAQDVDDGVLRLLRDELRVGEAARPAVRADRERRARRDPLGPVDGADPFVEGGAVDRLERRDFEQDPRRDPRPEAHARRVDEVPLEVHAPAGGPHAADAELAKLIAEGGLGALGCGREEAHGESGY